MRDWRRTVYSWWSGLGPRAPWLVAVLLVLAFVSSEHRRTLGGTVAGLVLAGVIGALVLTWLSKRSRTLPTPSRSVGVWIACAIVLAAGALVFLGPSAPPFDFEQGDWKIHVYLVEELVAGLDRGRVPGYVHGLSSGDSPYELYPLATHWIAAQLARLLSMREEVSELLGWLGIGCHVLIAVGVARVAARVTPWWIAAACGVAFVLEAGFLFAGGAVAILFYALLDQSVASMFSVFGVGSLMAFLERPTWHGAVRVWILFALTAVAHPAGLVVSLAIAGALVVVAAVARDVRPRVALMGAAHVGIGAMAVAFIWAPYAARLLDWGGSYAGAAVEPAVALRELVEVALPKSTLPAVIAAGYGGILVGLWSRRGALVLIGSTVAALIVAYTDIPYVLSGIAPSAETARMGAFRFPGLAKPSLFVGAGFLGARLVARAGALAAPRDSGSRAAVGALLGIAVLLSARAIVPFASDTAWSVRELTQAELDDREGFDALLEWARARKAEGPGRFGRMFFESNEHYVQHIGSETGLPVFHGHLVPLAFLRERMTDTTPESLRRFGVRWIVKRAGRPAAGDPESEARFGTYVVRTVPGWDGSFAHLERGGGRVRVTNLENDRVVVELTDTDEPALVSFAMGYYPRWRARHEGRNVPLYGLKSSERSEARVVAAWIPPGRTVLTADAPLPSDTRGRTPSMLAGLAAAAFLIVSLVPALRRRSRRAFARASMRVRAQRGSIVVGSLVLLATGLLITGAGDREERVDALVIFDGFAAGARVRAKHLDLDVDPQPIKIPFTPCERIGWAGYADCGRAGRVGGTMSALLGNEVFSWPWAVPALVFTSRTEPAYFEVEMVRTLGGTYEASAFGEGASFRITLDDEREIAVGRASTEIELAEAPRVYRIEIEATLTKRKPAYIAMARKEPIAREQEIPEPPDSPPAELSR